VLYAREYMRMYETPFHNGLAYVPPQVNMTWLHHAAHLKHVFSTNMEFQESLFSKSIFITQLYSLLTGLIIVSAEVFVYACRRGCTNLIDPDRRTFERKITFLIMFTGSLVWIAWTMVWVQAPPEPYQRCSAGILFTFDNTYGSVSAEEWSDLRSCQQFLRSLHFSVKTVPCVAMVAMIVMVRDSFASETIFNMCTRRRIRPRRNAAAVAPDPTVRCAAQSNGKQDAVPREVNEEGTATKVSRDNIEIINRDQARKRVRKARSETPQVVPGGAPLPSPANIGSRTRSKTRVHPENLKKTA